MGNGALLWDMAGTLIPYDPETGRPGALPGCDEYLPEMGRDFRMFVTTGDSERGARNLLRGFDLLDHFAGVYGDLFAAVGKPYGAILAREDEPARRSLAVGDRLRTDVAADTDEVVTLLVNQDARIVNCATIGYVITMLQERADTFPAAFDALLAGAEPDPAAEGPAQGGEIVRAGRANGAVAVRPRLFRHTLLQGDRRVLVL